MNRPVIVTYLMQNADGDFPASMRWAAAMVPEPRAGTSWMATGHSEEAARAKLEAVWESQIDKRKGPRKKPAVDELDVIL